MKKLMILVALFSIQGFSKGDPFTPQIDSSIGLSAIEAFQKNAEVKDILSEFKKVVTLPGAFRAYLEAPTALVLSGYMREPEFFHPTYQVLVKQNAVYELPHGRTFYNSHPYVSAVISVKNGTATVTRVLNGEDTREAIAQFYN